MARDKGQLKARSIMLLAGCLGLLSLVHACNSDKQPSNDKSGSKLVLPCKPATTVCVDERRMAICDKTGKKWRIGLCGAEHVCSGNRCVPAGK